MIQTWDKVKVLFPLYVEMVSCIPDVSDIESMLQKIDRLTGLKWDRKLYDAALHGKNDGLEILLDYHEFSGPDLGEALKAAAKLESAKCVNIILQCRQFNKIPTYFIGQAFENVRATSSCKEALKENLGNSLLKKFCQV